MNDSGNGCWRDNWTLDGHRARIANTEDGMVFESGPVRGDHACNAVLWTKKSFSGDLKVSFEFTRLDTVNRFVNIIYFHANGIGKGPYEKDIHKWKHLRNIPYMRTYFQYMDMLHVSYAAFDNENDEPEDYIRVRRYPVREDRDFHQMEVDGTVFNTGLFKPGISYKMTWIKTEKDLALEIKGDNKEVHHYWDISTVEPTFNGPIGIRHMHQKCSRYKNFEIFTKE